MSQHHLVNQPSPASQRETRPPGAPVVAHYLVLGCAAMTTAALMAVGLVVTVRTGELMAWWEHGDRAGQNALVLAGGLGIVTVLGMVGSFVATSVWLLGLRRVAEWASPGTHQRRSAHWAVLGWVVPVVNLWFPFQVVADAARALGSRVGNPLPWWIAWLTLSVIPFLDRSGSEFASAAELMAWIHVQQAVAVVAVIACVLWWQVVRSATTAAVAATRGDTVGP